MSVFSPLRRSLPVAAVSLGVLASLAGSAAADCTQGWYSMPGMSGGTTSVDAMTWWDPDGAGPAGSVLIGAGEFNFAGGTPCNSIAAWTGAAWSPLGSGITGAVNARAVLPN